jgi:hypothetical protein
MEKKYWRLVFFAFAVCFLSYRADGQIRFSIGAKGGATFTSINKNDADNKTNPIGGAAGLFTNLSIRKLISIQPEILIQQKGASATINGNKNEIKLHYFQIPILFKFSIPILNSFYPHFFTGPCFTYRGDATYTSAYATFKKQRDLTIDNIRKHENAGILGLGIDIKKNKILFNFDIRYSFELYKSDAKAYHITFKNRDFTMLAGIGYRLGSLK